MSFPLRMTWLVWTVKTPETSYLEVFVLAIVSKQSFEPFYWHTDKLIYSNKLAYSNTFVIVNCSITVKDFSSIVIAHLIIMLSFFRHMIWTSWVQISYLGVWTTPSSAWKPGAILGSAWALVNDGIRSTPQPRLTVLKGTL